ncbi:MAG: hypothetical protein IPL99_29490 [Candidatus Competibacteraceae bacterium]|nr:hypothetical protein [Candidatus Competibacteraceae bacterium]
MNDDRTYTRLSDGVILSEEEMMEEAIRDGDWSDLYEDITDWIMSKPLNPLSADSIHFTARHCAGFFASLKWE